MNFDALLQQYKDNPRRESTALLLEDGRLLRYCVVFKQVKPKRIHDWVMDRLDSRGTVRFRPRLPALRKSTAHPGADKVMLVALDWGPPQGDFDRLLSPLRTAWLGNPAQAWFFPQPYLMPAVFDARDGSALGIARQQIWNESSPTAVEEHAKKLARKLLDPK